MLLAEFVPQLLWTADSRRRLQYANRRLTRFTGLSQEQAAQGGFWDAIHPDDRPAFDAAWDRAAETCEAWEMEHRLCHADSGEWRWHLTRCEPLPEKVSGDSCDRWVGSTTDIHDRRVLEESLRAREAQLRAITETMPQLVWSTRPDGYHDFFNKAWYDYTGTRPGATDGEGWSHLLHPEDRDRTIAVWNHSLATGEPYEIEYRFRQARTGKYRWFIGRANPLRNERGEIIRWMGTCTDIHDQRLAAEELARANQDLEHFAYAASHDLQEPLRTILLYAQLVQQRYAESLPAPGQSAVASILTGAGRLMNLLDDLKSFLRVGRTAVGDKPPVALNEVVNEVLESLKAAREEAGAEIAVDVMPSAYVDRSHFAQVIQNLVSNSLRYRGDRPARVRIGFMDGPSEPVFFVRDHGEGIPDEYHDKIFQAFRRLHGQKVAGSGLGLAICTRIVSLYGGRIWVDSSAGKGATFFFTLPDAFATQVSATAIA